MPWFSILRTLIAFVIFLPAVFDNYPAPRYDWLQFNGDAQHSGDNSLETLITAGNVNSLHRLFQVSLGDVADGAPAALSAVATSSGPRDLLFLTTRDGHILAVDALSGQLVWSEQVPAGSCRINVGSAPCFTTSSPAVDPDRKFVYSYGLDGKVHKYSVSDGSEVTAHPWPETTTIKGYDEKGSSSLAVATSRSGQSTLYVSNSGYPGDQGNYQGHITAINLADGSQKVFNALCSGQPIHFSAPGAGTDCPQVTAGIWSRAPVVYDSGTDRIFLSTGNGDFNPAARDWGDSVLALSPDGTGASGIPLDSYTPANFQSLANTDTDLGSTAPAILPALTGSRYTHLAVMGGKDQKLRLLNLQNLSGQGGPGRTTGEIGPVVQVPQGGEILTQPAVWTNPQDKRVWVFVATGSGTAGMKLGVDSSGSPFLSTGWSNSFAATSPLMVNGVLFEATGSTVRALNPLTGSLLWSDGGIGPIHWESPVAVDGKIYISDENGSLTAYIP